MARLSKRERILVKKTLNELFAKTDSAKSIRKRYRDIEKIWNYLDVPAKKKIRYNKPNETEVCVLKLIALQNAVLSLAVDCTDSTEQCLYSGLFGTISNTIIAVMRLAEDGFDYQAMSMIRNLFELYMTLIIATDSAEKRKAFISAYEPEDARKIWHQYFSKAKFSKMMHTFCHDRANFETVAETFQKWIDDNYKDLSSFAHNDYAYIVYCWRSQEDPSGHTHPNIWGEYVTWRKRIYSSLFTISWLSHILFFDMLMDSTVDMDLKYLLGLDHDDSAKIALDIIFDLQSLVFNLGANIVID